MQKQLEHIKKWAMQDHSFEDTRSVLSAIVRMCDDALQDPERGRTLRAPDVSALELLAEMQDNAFFLNNKESVKWRKKITAVLTNAERR